jgi:hypothetical protein
MNDKIYSYFAIVLCAIMATLEFMGMINTNQYISGFLWVVLGVVLIDATRTKDEE